MREFGEIAERLRRSTVQVFSHGHDGGGSGVIWSSDGRIVTNSHVARGYLGVGLQPVELPDHHKGLIVLSLEPDGPAAKAGVLIGDVLVSLGGTAVTDTDDIQSVLEGHAVGQKIEAGVVRGGAAVTIGIVVGERSRRN